VNDDETYKVRRGEIGGYVDYCDEKTIDYMNDLIKKELSANYGY
jgi:hypothetical protein